MDKKVTSMERLHIETTNRCTIKCPACPRTTWKELTGRNLLKEDLNLQDLKHFLNCNTGKLVQRFVLCGDYGDTIYYPKLFEMIKMFREKRFQIHTNGSYRPEEWWHKLNDLLTENDKIIFAIDGLDNDNEKYRINSNWNSIMKGLDIISKGPAKIMWQTIILSFNYNKLDEIKKFAESKGAEFFSIKTHRFGNESLRPPKDSLIENEFLYQESFGAYDPIKIIPKCHHTNTITASGYFMPCDWIRNPQTFYVSELWKNKEKWINRLQINKTTLDEAKKIVEEWVQNVIKKGNEGTAETICKMKCRAM